MSDIKTWSTTAASNNSASPDGAPESMAPSGVNNTIRENMAQVKAWQEDGWANIGHTCTYASATTFTIASVDYTSTYAVGRRIRIADTTTVYGLITASSYSSNTTVTVLVDGGTSLTSNMTGTNVSLGAPVDANPTNYSATDGIIITGQGSTNDVTIQNDTGADVLVIPTGTTGVMLSGDLSIAGDLTGAAVTSDTAQATTSGTTKTFSSIPAWVTKVTISFVGVSLATFGDDIEIVLGDSGGFETTGYTSVIFDLAADISGPTDAFRLTIGGDNAPEYTIFADLVKHNATNTWVLKSVAVEDSISTNPASCIGHKTLTGDLTQIKLQAKNGGAFDAGSINICYS